MRRQAKAPSVGSSSGRARHLFVLLCLALTAAMAFTAAPAFGAKTHPFKTAFGPEGPCLCEGATAFPGVNGIGIDEATGNVFVADGPVSIQIFGPDGGAPSGVAETKVGDTSTGEYSDVAIDNSPTSPSKGALYVTDTANHVVKQFLLNGSEEYELKNELSASPGFYPLGLAVDDKGNVFASDLSSSSVVVFNPAGVETGSIEVSPWVGIPYAMATDSSGDLYVQSLFNSQVAKFDINSSGEIEPGTTPVVIVADEAPGTGLAVDQDTGSLYVGRGDHVAQYSSSGSFEGEFGAGVLSSAQRIAISSTGDVYVTDFSINEGGNAVAIFGPEELLKAGIESASTSDVTTSEAVLRARINPNGFPTTYKFEYGPDSSYGNSSAELSAGSGGTAQPVSFALTGLAPGTTYPWRVVASNSLGTVESADKTFSTYRPPGAGESCPNQAYRSGASALLPDCRAYELVSPVAKNNIDIFPPITITGTIAMLDQAAASGEKLTYTTSQGFGDAQGVPYTSQYLASRDSNGWSSHAISPPQGLSPTAAGLRIDLEFTAFTADLCSAALRHTTDPPLAGGAPAGYFNLYRRQNCGPEGYEALTTTPPPNVPGSSYAPAVQGISADGRCTVFYANDQLTADANPGHPASSEDNGGSNRQLYESCDGQLRLVSVLPSGEANQRGSSTGTSNYAIGFRNNNSVRAVSADGTRIYWTESGEDGLGPAGAGNLFLRLNSDQPQSALSAGECTEAGKACTIAVSESGTAHFWSASLDGSKAFFSVTDGILVSQGGSGELFEFDLASKTSTPIAAEMMGVIGASEDGSRISFISKEVLSSGANSEGKSPVAGEPNLYLFDSGRVVSDRYRFIGILSSEDAKADTAGGAAIGNAPSPVNLFPFRKTSRVSPDGNHIAFMSTASLTGYDNTDAANGEADAEVFAYDATADGGEGQLRCVSCNPSGQQPTGRRIVVENEPTSLWGAALLPTYYTELYGSRVISDDGRRVYFNAYEALVPSDTNGKADVYQWQAPGSGTCTEASPAYSPVNEGCVNLISSGESPDDSEFIDASPDGRDVFFTTGASLLPQDPGLVDIYDARAGGGYPATPGQPAACEGEACQGPLSPPSDPTPASASFNGAGNVKPAARKHQKKKAHKKKAQHKKKAHKKQQQRRQASHNRRSAR